MTFIQGMHKWIAALVAVGLIFGAPVANAVMKNVAVVDSNGDPVKNATVTIVFPNGDEEQAETDDDGFILFNFPDEGSYTIRFAGGQMAYTVPAGALAGGAPVGAIVGGVLGTIAAAAAISNNSGSDDGPTEEPFVEADPSTTSDSDSSGAASDSGGGSSDDSGGSSASVDGTYSASTTITLDPDGHQDMFGSATYTVSTEGSVVTISGSGPELSFSVRGELTGADFFATGNGTYRGFPTDFQLQGKFNAAAGTWEGNMRAGGDGALPDSNDNGSHEPIEVSFNGSRQ